MSADSPRRSGGRMARQSGGSVCGNGGGQVVAPQPVTDPSIIDSVTGFINDVVPQAYTSTLPGDCKETITWARFESADINDPTLFPDSTADTVLPLILILGYNTGVQVWAIPANGEATEVLSWSQGSVRTLRILPSPSPFVAHSSDSYAMKRPLVAICDSAGPGPPFCSVSFISLKTGDQVKSIKFKNPVCDVSANRRSVIVTFPERIAVFDACTLEDRLSITSCYLSPGPNANPVALGSRWLAFAEKKLVAWKRSSGGVGGGGAQSYTATVLHAAQSLGRGLRGLSETVASSLTGPRMHSSGQMGSVLGSSPPTVNGTDHSSPGIVSVVDLEASLNRCNGSDEGHPVNSADSCIAHFVAHSEAIVALEFDPSGTLLVTADRRGHDFHVFRLQPHPSGSSLAAVHHLYVLHRGDTTAKVQNVAFSCDSRWVAVSTMRGTTHVFPLTPYGGPVGFRTHGSPLVVNRLSRFHRSAGLSADGRSSPVPSPESPPCLPSGPHANPRLPPYPHPSVQAPLAQLRQSPHPPLAPAGTLDVSLKVCATFASPRAWLLDSQTTHPRDGPRDSSKVLRRPVDSLFVMAHHGNLVQYDLDPKPVTTDPREKICDDTKIDLDVEAKAQWPLQRSSHSPEVLPPLPPSNPLLCGPELRMSPCDSESNGQSEERWLSQVEIVTHAGPHRRLWMGPQITFKTYTSSSSGSNVSLQDVEAVEVGTVPVSRPARSNPVNMPAGGRPVVPVLIESGSGSSFEQSPHLLEVYGADSGEAEHWCGHGDSRLREDLADAMLESPGAPSREKGKRRYCGLVGGGEGEGGDGVGEGRGFCPVRRVVNPGGAEITVRSDGEDESDCDQLVDQSLTVPIPVSDPHSDHAHHWEAIAIPATASLIPVPHDPAPESATQRQHVTTIAAVPKGPKKAEKKKPAGPAGRGDDSSLLVCSVAVEVPVVEATKNTAKERQSYFAEEEGSVGRKRATPEREKEKYDSIGKESELQKHECVRTTQNSEPLPSRKKSKKGSVINEGESVTLNQASSVQADEVSSDISLIQRGVDSNSSDPLQGMSSKKGKKTAASQESFDVDRSKAPPKGATRKSLSPQKDVVESKVTRRSSCSAEKETEGEASLTSISTKKSKSKATAVVKEVSRKVTIESLAGASDICTDELVKEISLRPSIAKVNQMEIADGRSIQSPKEQEFISAKNIDSTEAFKFQSDVDDVVKDEQNSNVEIDKEILSQGDPEITNETAKPVLQTQKLSKSARRALKAQQNLREELASKGECEENAHINEKSDIDLTACKLNELKISSIEDEELIIRESPIISSSQECNITSIDCELVSVMKKDLEEAALDAGGCVTVETYETSLPLAAKDIDGGNIVASDTVSDTSSHVAVKSKRKSPKVCKALGSDINKDGSKPKTESVSASNAWNTPSISEKNKDSDHFPALSSKYAKTAWGNSHEEAAKVEETDHTNMTIKSDVRDLGSDVVKPKRGWEIPTSAEPPEMDIEKLTFEDLEAIVDAARKEEETKIEQNCLKENKKGKKADVNNVLNPPKTKGKENIEEEVSNGGVNCVEIVEAPEDLIKQEEPVKIPEKPLSTPNRSSKAHRRKRR